MSRLQMQQSKERAAQAKRMQRDRYRLIGDDERVDLRKLGEDQKFVTVPKGIDGARVNRTNMNVELLRGEEVVETLDHNNEAAFERRLEMIRASLSPKERTRWNKLIGRVCDEYSEIIDRDDWIRASKPEIESLIGWGSEETDDLQRPDKCVTPDLLEALGRGRVACSIDLLDVIKARFEAASPVPFLIEHDWAAAFAGATDIDEGDIRLPYDSCMFELKIGGRRVACYCDDNDWKVIFISIKGGWVAGEITDEHFLRRGGGPSRDIVENQIRAICIALDAEVAVKETVRADEKLNRSREKRGKPPLLDYHVIRLARRERAAPLPSGDDDGERKHRSPRLHFVRGHWRHYDSHKTWINWHLRGDPDLGFIDKHYRL